MILFHSAVFALPLHLSPIPALITPQSRTRYTIADQILTKFVCTTISHAVGGHFPASTSRNFRRFLYTLARYNVWPRYNVHPSLLTPARFLGSEKRGEEIADFSDDVLLFVISSLRLQALPAPPCIKTGHNLCNLSLALKCLLTAGGEEERNRSYKSCFCLGGLGRSVTWSKTTTSNGTAELLGII